VAKILIVEDDPATLEALKSFLSAERHSVDSAPRAAEAIDFIRTYEYDVLIVDWEMPGMTGIEFIEKFRANGGNTPVIMLTGKSATDEKISGLESGADYYLTKPFEGKALLSFIRASMRRVAEITVDMIVVGNLELHPSSAEVTCDGKSVTLSNKEAAVLRLLMKNPERIVSHEELKRAGWADADVPSGTIRVFLTALREKLQSIGATNKILSLRGFGYRIE